MSKTVLYFFDHTDIGSRLPLALAAQDCGYTVTIALFGSKPAQANIPDSFEIIEIPKPENKFSPFAIFKTMRAIRAAVCARKPDLVHVVTLKYSFLSGLAILGCAPTAIIYTIAGLGFAFRSEGWKPALLRTLIAPFLKLALKHKNAHLVIQNQDDKDLLINRGYADAARAHLVVSSGVNLDRFTASPEPETGTPIALMVTRLVHEKGVHIFAEAAKILKAEGINARFQIAGGLTMHNPQAITKDEMERLISDSGAEWLGRVDDVPALLSSSAIVVYPSYYGEGVPRVLLEACAAGRPIISTDHPGCKEPVFHGDNGMLIPIKDVQATANAMRTLLQDQGMRARMGRKSREVAMSHFDVNIINTQTLAVYDIALRQQK